VPAAEPHVIMDPPPALSPFEVAVREDAERRAVPPAN
jgi:hypothetical protein